MPDQPPSGSRTRSSRPLILLAIVLVISGIVGLTVGIGVAAIALGAGAALIVGIPLSTALRPWLLESERAPGSSNGPHRSRGSLGFIVNLIERDGDGPTELNTDNKGTSSGSKAERRDR